jgi:hypothetical protein
MYPPTLSGLEMCYIAGLPFFKNTLTGDMAYTALMFGLFELSVRAFPALRLQKAVANNNFIH